MSTNHFRTSMMFVLFTEDYHIAYDQFQKAENGSLGWRNGEGQSLVCEKERKSVVFIFKNNIV